MEPAQPQPPLIKPALKNGLAWERLLAAPMLFLALASCGKPGAPVVLDRLRIGLGASALAASPDYAQTGTLAVACRRSNDVWVLDMKANSVMARIDTGAKPRAVLFHGEKQGFYVAEGLSQAASVVFIQLHDRRVARRYKPKGLLSRWQALPQQELLLAARLGEPVLGIYRLKDLHLKKTVDVGGEVTAVAARPGAWWVATRQADSLARLSPADLSLQAVALAGPEPRSIALDDGHGLAYVPCQGRLGEAAPLALPKPTPTLETLSPLELTDTAESLEEDAAEPAGLEDPEDLEAEREPAEDRFAGGGLAIFRLKDTRRLSYLEIPGGPSFAALSADGSRLALACADGQLRMVDLARGKVTHMLKLGGTPGAMMEEPGSRRLLVALSDSKQLLRIQPGAGW
jgi:YVTN family beta-propeller protein